MKKIMLGILIVQIVLFVVLLSIDFKPKSMANSPSRTIDSSIRKDSPSQAVLNQSTFIEEDIVNLKNDDGLEEIKQKYRSLFTKLEETTSTRLLNLMVAVFDEFQEKGIENQSLLSMTDYYQEFKDLEDETDQEFSRIYEEMKTELKNNGYSIEDAVEFRLLYEQKKKKQLETFLEQFNQ
ncbi:hypothetical protein [Litchfieldia salsa]|uniref:Uncharacterized protein n=1 Tax=Litchfieldia salsa TaxID=930152 RepID=A0A1H0WVU3_9BACI|nr:hypothetical protein [Litchfieldia salsa]SDP94811.1 hypothetical protein SAMN05216565_11713 [Litchfieldia salsa]